MEEDVGRVVVRIQGSSGRLTACRDVVPGSRHGKCEDEGEECEDQGEECERLECGEEHGQAALEEEALSMRLPLGSL